MERNSPIRLISLNTKINALFIREMTRNKGRCEGCGRKINNSGLINYIGKRLCKKCYRKKAHIIKYNGVKKSSSSESKLKS